MATMARRAQGAERARHQLDLLPSFRTVLTTAAELLDYEIQWLEQESSDDGVAVIEAIGSGPSDDQIEIVQWRVSVGQYVRRGDPLASVEACRAVFEMGSTVEGTVEALLVYAGRYVPVGEPIARIRCQPGAAPRPSQLSELSGTAVLQPKPKSGRLILPRTEGDLRQFEVGISSIATVEGRRLISNRDLLASGRLRISAVPLN